jgi:hypothetical protein
MARSRHSCSSRLLQVAVASACACAAIALFPKEAHAGSQFDLGVDGDATALMAPSPTQYNLSTLGTGLKVRFGDRIGLRYGMHITPEVGYAFDHIFVGGAPVGAISTVGAPENMNRIFAGARLGFGRWVIPSVYAHAGYGFRSLSENGTVAQNASTAGSGFTFDAGVAVDFKLAKHLMIGPHAEYVIVDAPITPVAGLNALGAPQWLAFGGHLDILF